MVTDQISLTKPTGDFALMFLLLGAAAVPICAAAAWLPRIRTAKAVVQTD